MPKYLDLIVKSNVLLINFRYNLYTFGDDRLRRRRLIPDCEPRGTDLVKSVHQIKCQTHKLCNPPISCLVSYEGFMVSQ